MHSYFIYDAPLSKLSLSRGSSDQDETPKRRRSEEANRHPRGLRIAWDGTQWVLKATMYAENIELIPNYIPSNSPIKPVYWTKGK